MDNVDNVKKIIKNHTNFIFVEKGTKIIEPR